jgi:hypothetical protein
MIDLLLLHQPRREDRQTQAFALQPNRLIWLDSAAPQKLHFAAQRFRQALIDYADLTWPIVAGATTASDQVGLALRLAPDRIAQSQGMNSHEPGRITIAAHDERRVLWRLP